MLRIRGVASTRGRGRVFRLANGHFGNSVAGGFNQVYEGGIGLVLLTRGEVPEDTTHFIIRRVNRKVDYTKLDEYVIRWARDVYGKSPKYQVAQGYLSKRYHGETTSQEEREAHNWLRGIKERQRAAMEKSKHPKVTTPSSVIAAPVSGNEVMLSMLYMTHAEEYDYWSYRLQFATPEEKRSIELHLKHSMTGQRIERKKTLQEEAAEHKNLMEERERQRLIALAKEYTR